MLFVFKTKLKLGDWEQNSFYLYGPRVKWDIDSKTIVQMTET